MKITYDTVTDSISCPDLTPEQTRQLQAQLSAALARDDSVRTVASTLLATAKALAQDGRLPGGGPATDDHGSRRSGRSPERHPASS